MKSLLPWILSCLAACDPNGSGAFGTSVGNPGKETFRLAPPIEDTTEFLESFALVDGQYLVGCDGTYATVVVDEEVDLLGGPAIPVPAGVWCALVLDVESLTLEATVGDVPLVLEVLPDGPWTWWMSQPVVVDETEWVIELGAPGWLSAEDFPEGGETIVVTDGEPTAAALEGRLGAGAVFEDLDGDGEVSEEERENGSLATFEEIPPGVEPEEGAETRVAVDGCQNCSTSSGDPPLWAPAVIALVTLRRRPRRARSARSPMRA